MKKSLVKVLAITASVCMLPFNYLKVEAVKNNWDSEWKAGGVNYKPSSSSTLYCTGPQGGKPSYCSSKYDSNGRNRPCCIRDKGDTSSIYVYNKSNKPVKVIVWGEVDWQNPQSYDVSYIPGGSQLGNTWRVPKYSERLIPQYIKEKDYDYAHVHFENSGAYGLWSADSSGWYPRADKLTTMYP